MASIVDIVTGKTPLGALMRGGALAGAIKLSSAGLSFLMFAAIAMAMDPRQFGLFSATFAGASLVSFFASIGQQSTVLRFWPQYAETGDLPSAHAFMARAIAVAFAGSLIAALLTFAVGFVPWIGSDTPEWRSLCMTAGLLGFALSWSEFLSGALRSKSVLVFALLPRDVIWRAVVIALVAAGAGMGMHLHAATITLVAGTTLLLVTLPQTVQLLAQTVRADRGTLSPGQRREFTQVTLGLWGATSLPAGLGQVSTLLVAAILGPTLAGPIFVAERTTRLAALALSGINQALAPQISASFYGGDREHLQKISGLTALGGFAVAAATLVVFVFFGRFVLAIFDPSYATATMHAVLVLFALGTAVATACGPVNLVMQLTGLQGTLLNLVVVANLVGLAATALGTWLFGPLGAAATMGATVAIWNVIAVVLARRAIGVDTSLLGLSGFVRPPAEAAHCERSA
ncbi:lipopolysaccharide biosynthesis protein [Pararhizobium mangrovi]|uniref:Lipopolysaccharide biosynthesis protein n=1 Tax=Pararhizobium mangrovi TaxID=2590452 RepID=A0A506UHR0_9HYPH|nr:lipopolysaccharide biosynthesis protein [Pararhizobium mangrovi]TPW32839.1 lipopolysaccharide biosynthesis protein [Pararhizobium mangrovi]